MGDAKKPWIIYLLKDPRTDEVRYVGVTHQGRGRLSQHVYSVKRLKTHTATWVKSLLKAGVRPLMETVEAGEGSTWVEREIHWIAEYRRQGARLTNHTLGGEGTLGWSPSPESRAKTSERTKRVHTGMKRSPETKARMSEAQKRYHERLQAEGIVIKHPPRSAETLERMSKAQLGKKASEAVRQKMSESSRRRELTPELRKAFGEGMRKRSPEWKAWFAQIQKGVPKSAETKAKMAAAKQGKGQFQSLEQIDAKILAYVQEQERRPSKAISAEWRRADDWLRWNYSSSLFQRCQALGVV